LSLRNGLVLLAFTVIPAAFVITQLFKGAFLFPLFSGASASPGLVVFLESDFFMFSLPSALSAGLFSPSLLFFNAALFCRESLR